MDSRSSTLQGVSSSLRLSLLCAHGRRLRRSPRTVHAQSSPDPPRTRSRRCACAEIARILHTYVRPCRYGNDSVSGPETPRRLLRIPDIAIKKQASKTGLLDAFGVERNPFPTASQTSGNPHYPIPEDGEAEDRIVPFIREGKSEVLVVLGTQGVGKTNFLNYLESEIRESELEGIYIVRYLADPEPSFDATIRTILQELGIGHLRRIVAALSDSDDSGEVLLEVKSGSSHECMHGLG